MIKKSYPKRDKQKYYDYLKSDQWKEKRRLAYEIYGGSCGMCGGRHNIQVHHRNYLSIFKERIEDLMLLCETCHSRFHKHKAIKKKQSTADTFYPNRKKNI